MKLTTDETGVIECHLSKPDRQAIRSCWKVLEELAFHGRRSVPNTFDELTDTGCTFADLADLVGALVPTEVVTFETQAKDEADA